MLSVAYRSCRAARVRFQTTRTHPNVRDRTACCPGLGYARHRYAILTLTGDTHDRKTAGGAPPGLLPRPEGPGLRLWSSGKAAHPPVAGIDDGPAGAPAAAGPAVGAGAAGGADAGGRAEPRAALEAVRAGVAKAVVGQDSVVTGLVICLLCRGHALLE